MLTLAGIGLRSEMDVPLGVIELAKKCDLVYLDTYTNIWKGKDGLEKIVGKNIIDLKRDRLEQGAVNLAKQAKDKDVMILVPGDPLVATTHTTIISEAKALGVKTRVIHASSIFSAICETGLHVYKFGATATLPFLAKTGGKLPKSVYKILEKNLKNDFHTLLLLDITPEKCMSPNEGFSMLLELERENLGNLVNDNTLAIVFARAGSEDSKIWFGKIQDLKDLDFGKPPMIIIVPGKLHFSEKEYLDLISEKF